MIFRSRFYTVSREKYRNDGPYILWTICNHIHHNNIAFIETIKQRIHNTTLAQFDNNVLKYIMTIRDNLRLITTSSQKDTHKDLLTYLFRQLTACTIEPFKQAMQNWHVDYLEAKTPDLSPTSLLKKADTKVQILQHAGHWTPQTNPEVMALKLALQAQRDQSDLLVKQLTAHVTCLVNHNNGGRPGGPYKHNRNGQRINGSHPALMTIAPTYPTETKMQDGRLYTWCTKCRQGQGLWVCKHNTETHIDGFQQDRDAKHRSDSSNHLQSFHPENQTPGPSQGARSGPAPTPPQNYQGQLSFLDYLDSYLLDHSHDEADNTSSLEQE
jgi:hypothetical protein